MAKRFLFFVALFVLIFVVQPRPALTLGVAGFDLYRPIHENPDSAFHFNLKPGETIEDRVMLKNTSETTQNLRIYITDGIPTSNGGISLKKREAPRNGLSRWIKLDSSEDISLAPGEERSIRFQLDVPMSSKSDERIAGIVVERAEALKGREGQQFIINILPRAAILITQRLPGAVLERLKITGFSENWLKGNKVLKMAVRNTGNVHSKPTGQTDIFNMFGSRIKSFRFDSMATIFPKKTHRVSSEWKNPPAVGYFTAKASIKYGEGKSDSKEIRFLIFPWWILPVLLALWIVARDQRKRRALRRLKKLEKEQAATALETLEETVEAIAEKEILIPSMRAATKTEQPILNSEIAAGRKRVDQTIEASSKTASSARKTVKTSKKPTKKAATAKPKAKKAATKPKAKKSTTTKSTAKKTAAVKPKTKTKKSTAAKPKVKKAATKKATTTGKPKTKKATTAKPKAKKAATKPKAKKSTTTKAKAKKSTTAKPKAKTTARKTKKPAAAKKKTTTKKRNPNSDRS